MDNNIWVNVVFGLLCAFVCFSIARAIGRGPYLAAILGWFFGIFAIIFYAVMAIFDHNSGRTQGKREAQEKKDYPPYDEWDGVPKRPDR